MRCVLLLIALFAVGVLSLPESVDANKPLKDGKPIPDNFQDRIADRYKQAQDLIKTLTDNLDKAKMGIQKLHHDLDENDQDADAHWRLYGIPIVLLVVIGYTLFEAGNVRSVNVVQVLFKNALIAVMTAVVWWACGFAHAYGDDRENGTSNGFVGNGKYFLISDKVKGSAQEYGVWAYSWAYAVMAAIIATQSLGERARTPAYLIITFLFVGFIYPTVVHWCWSTSGWISPFVHERATFGRTGVIDRAGSGVVHITAGFAALAGAFFLRGRQGRFDEDYQRQFPQKFRAGNRVYQGVGVFFIWVAWYGLTAVSPIAQVHGNFAKFGGRATITTTLSAAFGVLTTIVVDSLIEGKKIHAEGEEPSFSINTFRMLNGAIAGLVAVSAGAHVYEPWAAIFVGAIGALVYVLGARLLIKLNIDDALEVVSAHGFAGVAGLMCVGWFAHDEDVAFYYRWLDERQGIWYGGNAGQWGVQSITVAAIAGWGLLFTGIFYFILSRVGLLRVSSSIESEGIDANETVYTVNEEAPKKAVN